MQFIDGIFHENWFSTSIKPFTGSQGFGTKEEDISLRIEKVIKKSPYQS